MGANSVFGVFYFLNARVSYFCRMNLIRSVLFFAFLVLCLRSEAQYTQPYQIKSPLNGTVVHIGGTKSQNLSITWWSGKVNNAPAGVNYFYKVYFDSLQGDISSPLSVRDVSCCQSGFNDTSFSSDMGTWAAYLNGISKTVEGKDFQVGDTLTLNVMIDLTAIDGAPNYEFRASDSVVLHFVRTQFSDEYTPFNLQFPQQDLFVDIGGNPNTLVNFTWQTTACPGGCGAAEYTLMIDTVNAGFEYPYSTISVPLNGNSWAISYNTLNQILVDCAVPENASRTVYWTVMATGPGKTTWANQVYRLHLTNRMLNNEHHAYNLLSPNNNTTVTLKGQGNQQLSFRWESTYTPVANTPEFYLVFDTAGASPIFGNPIWQFKTDENGLDSIHALTYGFLKEALDSTYGKNWGKVNLMWTAKALLGGDFYYANKAYNINLIESFITNFEAPQAQSLECFPNPASDRLYLRGLTREASYRLVDALGKVLVAGQLNSSEAILLSKVANGVYWLEVHDAETVHRKRIAIRR